MEAQIEREKEKFYNSERWKHIRSVVLRRDKFQCQLSKRYGKIRPAEMVHHIFPREQFPEYQWETWNLISLSNEMHNAMHDRRTNKLTHEGMELLKETGRKMGIETGNQRILVIGLPRTGKSTYVRKHMTEDSLAYDLDAIAAAFRLRQPHEEYHDASRRMANDLLMGFVENAEEYVTNVYIIRTAPRIPELERINPNKVVWCRHQYKETDMDNKEEALERIEAIVKWCAFHSKKIEVPPHP